MNILRTRLKQINVNERGRKLGRIRETIAATGNRHKTLKGGTLLIIVITILVLLILASATIVTLTEENGIINAKEASEQAKIAGYVKSIHSSVQYLELDVSIFDDEEDYLEKLDAEIQNCNIIEETADKIMESEDIEITTEENYVLCISKDKLNYAGTTNNISPRPPNVKENMKQINMN